MRMRRTTTTKRRTRTRTIPTGTTPRRSATGDVINGEDEQMDDEDDESDDEDDEDDEDEDDEDDVDVDADADPDLEAELAAFREEEAEANRLAAARSQNAVKGAAVRRQNDAWERSLQARILLQRGVNAAAKLPTPAYMDALKASDEGVAPAAATAAGARGARSRRCCVCKPR